MASWQEFTANTPALVDAISTATGMTAYQESACSVGQTALLMLKKGTDKQLALAFTDDSVAAAFTGEQSDTTLGGTAAKLKLCPLTHANADAARNALDFLVARPLGVNKSFGAGDRLGIATPGHVRAVRRGKMRPIFCQQSIREMTRTVRTPHDVMDDACWGVLQTGYCDGFGADADHLKVTEDIDSCLAAGFTFFTVDPGDHVDSSADTADTAAIEATFSALPWDRLGSTAADCRAAYADKTFELTGPNGSFSLTISAEQLTRAAVKYGKAIAHVAMMYQRLTAKAGAGNFEFEVSVDETETPTSIAEHYYVAAELKRLDIEWVSLAPRFIGDFEKGVDYIGDLERFRAEFAQHVAVAKRFGPYKISLHSGSDKFSIYPIAAELAGDLVHLKTAGTSYLEALRAIARVDTALFRDILTFAKQRYPEDRATYHVSAVAEKVANPNDLTDDQLPAILDQFDTREACHVTYGSVLQTQNADGSFIFRDRFFKALRENEDVYYDILDIHIGKHIAPFG